MTVEEYLAEAERFRILKEQASDPINQHLFAQMERSYRTLAECDALLKSTPKTHYLERLFDLIFAG